MWFVYIVLSCFVFNFHFKNHHFVKLFRNKLDFYSVVENILD